MNGSKTVGLRLALRVQAGEPSPAERFTEPVSAPGHLPALKAALPGASQQLNAVCPLAFAQRRQHGFCPTRSIRGDARIFVPDDA